MSDVDAGYAMIAMYVGALTLSSAPLWHLIATGRIVSQFVYATAVASFIVINLLGSMTANVLSTGQGMALQSSLLVTALAMAVLYPVLLQVAPATRQRVDATPPWRISSARMRGYFVVWTMLTVFIVGIFWVLVSPPLLLRFDLYGEWDALIALRTEIVFGPHRFHWFALGFFDIPLVLCCIAVVHWRLAKAGGDLEEERKWRRLIFAVGPWFALLSVAFLHRTYLVYLIVATVLSMVAVDGKVGRRAVWAGTATILALIPLYIVYWGVMDQLAPVLLEIITHRIFEVYPWGAAVALDLFPTHQDYLSGRSLINIFGAFTFEQVNVSTLLYPHIYEVEEGSAPLPALYEMYVNWGWPGFALGVYAALAVVLGCAALSWVRSALALSLSVYLTIGLVQLWQAPFWFGTLSATRVLLVAIIIAGWRAFPSTSRMPGNAGS